ncbi:MAG: ChuX/HutX family heme-like substrate-binding protein [Gammaproteobacteria bacterium]
MIRSGLIVVFATAWTALLSPAVASDFCADTAQSAKVQAFYAEHPGTMPVIAARRLGLAEAVVVSGLASGQSASASGTTFADVWSAMSKWNRANFLIMKGDNVFEISSAVGTGKPSSTSKYYNISYDQPLRGHLRPDQYASIYAVDMPGESAERTVRGVLFYDQDGASVFGAFFSGEGPDPAPGEIRKFDAVMNLVKASPSFGPKR